MEIKLDGNTLPKDQSHIQFQTFESEMYDKWLKGFYSDGVLLGRDNIYYSIRTEVSRWIGINDAIPKPLEIGA